MKYLVMITLLAAVSAASAADWVLSGLVYHDYCPPAAIKQDLCSTGQDFDASTFIVRPREVGDFLLNQIGSDETGIKFGSLIVMPSPTKNSPNRKQRYALAEILPGEDVLDGLDNGVLTATNGLGRELVIDIKREDGRCGLHLRGLFTEPTNLPGANALRDATMTFSNARCIQQ